MLFVLDHGAKPAIGRGELEPWATDLRTFAGLPNTVVKLSGLLTECDWNGWTVDDLRPYVEVITEAFGPDRMMLGTDWPVSMLVAPPLDTLIALEAALPQLSPTEWHAVRAATAHSVYRLGQQRNVSR